MRPPAFTMAGLVDSGRYEADRAAELRRCVSRSKEQAQEQLERETQTPRSAGGCGRVAMLQDRHNLGTYAAARLPCKRKGCTDCRPTEDAKRRRHFVAMMNGYQMRRRTIEPAARRAALAKHRRAGQHVLPIPAPDGLLVVWATGGAGELVTDLQTTLAADLAAAPVGRPIVPSRGWSRSPVAARGTGRWKLDGMVKVALAQLVKAALDAGYYLGQVPAKALPPEWAEAHLLQRPADDLAWRRFQRRIGLHWPQPRQRRRRAA